jgi:hypothetical protein
MSNEREPIEEDRTLQECEVVLTLTIKRKVISSRYDIETDTDRATDIATTALEAEGFTCDLVTLQVNFE